MDLSTRLPAWLYHSRRLWQRWATDLPVGAASWDALFGPDRQYADGVFHARPGFTGVLRIERGQPFTVEPVRYRGTVPRRLAWDDRRYFACEPDRIVRALSDAVIYTHAGIVYDPRSRLVIAETLEEWEHGFVRHPMFAAPRFPRRELLPGRAFLLGGAGAGTFYHFLVEALPALIFAKDLASECDHLLVPDGGRAWKLRWLLAAGADEGKIRWLPPLAHVQCEQLVFTSRLVRHFEPNPWAVDTLRSLFPAAGDNTTTSPGCALWLDRSHMPARRVSWEAALVSRLPQVECARFDELSPVVVAERCRSARTLAGFHGAALANMVFCKPGARIIEILTQPNFPWYGRLAQICGHEHLAVQVDDSPSSLETLADLLPRLLAGETDPAPPPVLAHNRVC